MIDATLNLLVILFIDFLKNLFLNTVASFLVGKKGEVGCALLPRITSKIPEMRLLKMK